MENKELLNPQPEDNDNGKGVENLDAEKKTAEQTTEDVTPAAENKQKPESETRPQKESVEEEAQSPAEPAAQETAKEKEEETPEISTEQEEKQAEAEKEKPVEEQPVAEPVAERIPGETEEKSPDVVAEPEEAKPEAEKEDPAEESATDPVSETKDTKEEETAETVAEESEEKVEQVKEKTQEEVVVQTAEEKKEVTTAKKTKETPAEEEEEDLADKYNSLKKEELVEAIEALVQHEDINYIRRHIGYMKVAFRNFIKEQSVSEYEKNMQHSDSEAVEGQAETEEVVDEMTVRFDKAFGIYKQKKTVYDQALERQKHDNLKTKENILEELRQLIESEEELKKTYDVFKELQEKWREIGPVPQSANNTLWNNYHFLVEKFFDKVKINKELRDLDLKKNLEVKTELCEKAEGLLLDTSVNKSFQKLQKLHEAWKEIGPVPKDFKDEIWERFKVASDTLNERRQKYYDGLREEQNKNYAAKIVLCEKAEQLAEVISEQPRQWQEATDNINELFKVWKTIGFAPKKVNDEVWVRFRTALDNFFKNKKEFFQKYKDEQSENYNRKLNLCVQAEALKDSEDWKRTTDELIALQQEWKKIGPVPRKFSDKIWKRFRAACDEFFNRKAAYFSNIGEKQDENLQKKKELVEKIRNYEYSKDNTENLNVLNEFQRQWMDIGHVPIKQKDAIQNEFRNAINEQFDKLNISRKAKSTIGFKNKIENLKNSPNADNIIYKERSFLLNKINALQNDIKLWENNIGFFASSKKADVLKQEFESKIEKAKTDIAVLEEKLKILNASQS